MAANGRNVESGGNVASFPLPGELLLLGLHYQKKWEEGYQARSIPEK